jgi:hypothetical protein
VFDAAVGSRSCFAILEYCELMFELTPDAAAHLGKPVPGVNPKPPFVTAILQISDSSQHPIDVILP